MTAEDTATALEPFGQVNRDKSQTRGGASLGLPLSKALVELHGGTFEIESTYGKGTTVRFVFPSSRSVTTKTPPPPSD